MNSIQVKNIATWLVTLVSGYLVGWAASRGYQWGDIIHNLLSSEVVIGVVGSAITAVLAWLSGRIPWIVAIVDALAKRDDTPIAGVITTDTPEGRQLANSLPGTTTAPAGTTTAEGIAKS